MKFLVAVSALLAVAAAFPSENARVKRGILGLGGHGGLGNAILAGPSGVIAAPAAPAHYSGAALLAGPAHTSTIVSGPSHAATIVAAPGPSATLLSGPAHGYLAAAPAHGYLAAAPAHGYLAAAPAHGYIAAAAAPAHAGPGAISTHTQTAGVINSPSATLIGPSTDGHPGAIIPKGGTALHGYNYAHGHAYKAALWG